ncbi:MAG: methionine adenosyltransferase [Albidovulum sp.]|nr:methionine adenosyltransferase [Albidovulum sp.]MDE0533234.1 methionine adenosyltransferase [Albidovulum sp.]
MSRQDYLFSSESVAEGHPDKVCDQISDSVLDAFLAEDPVARVACETMATTNRVMVAGEVRGPDSVIERVEDIVRECVKDIGYEQEGFHWQNLEISNYLHEQSKDIAQGVDADTEREEGAGDQGMMFGYAVDETPSLMPAPIHYAHEILRALAVARKSGREKRLGPDAKSQLTVRYEAGRPAEIASVVVSAQHIDDSLTSNEVREIVEPYVRKTLPDDWLSAQTEWWINPTGKFAIGGPDGDTGLTGRKIVVDTYGGAAPHGGGAFSGKDPSKVDRSAAYAARYLAKNVVAAGLAQRCCIQIAYAIGVAMPLSVYVDTYGTGRVPDVDIENAISRTMDLSPGGIRSHLQLARPIYRRTAAYGHFGRNPEADGGFSWEKTDLVERLRQEI